MLMDQMANMVRYLLRRIDRFGRRKGRILRSSRTTITKKKNAVCSLYKFGSHLKQHILILFISMAVLFKWSLKYTVKADL